MYGSAMEQPGRQLPPSSAMETSTQQPPTDEMDDLPSAADPLPTDEMGDLPSAAEPRLCSKPHMDSRNRLSKWCTNL